MAWSWGPLILFHPPMPQDLLSPDEFGQMLDDPEFAKLPFDTRKTYVEKGIGEASRFIAERDGGWTPELWQNFGAAAQQARQFVSESETFGETAMRYAGVAGQTIKDLPAIIGTGVVGLSPVLPDGQGGVTGQVPGETLGPALGRNIVGLAASGAAMLSDAEQPLVQKLGALKQQIDQGDFLAHQQGFGGWIDEQNQAVRDTQKQFYGNADWADQNSLLGNEENVKLMQSYLTTRSPQAWEALQANLLRTPFRAKLQADKQALENDTTLGRALAPEARPLISEAADPAELLPGMLAVKKGVQIATKGASAGSRALDAAKGIAGEMLGEQVSATIDNPYLSAAERLQIAKDSLAGSLGLMGVGVGAKAAVQALSPSTINPELSTNDGLPPNQTPAPTGAPQTPGATPGAAPLAGAAGPLPSTLSRIAQESLVPDLPEDTGELTADEVADLEGVGQTMSDPSTTPPTQTPLTPGERAPADQIAQNAIAGVTAEPAQTITGSNVQTGTEMPVPSPTAPAGAGTGAMVAAPQVGDVVNYEGYAGRLQQDGQRLVVEVPNGPVIEVSDPETVQRAVGETAQQVRLAELQAMPDPQVSEAQFIPAEDGTLSLRDNNGNTYVPHNDQLLRSVRMNEQGQVEVLLRNLKRPGQVIKLTGQQAEQAQDAILAAAINVEQQGGTVRYGTSRGLQNLQGGNRSNAGSTTLPGAAADALVNLASAAVRAGQTFAQWATSMLQRFGEAVRQYLQGAWQAAMRTSEVGAINPQGTGKRGGAPQADRAQRINPYGMQRRNLPKTKPKEARATPTLANPDSTLANALQSDAEVPAAMRGVVFNAISSLESLWGLSLSKVQTIGLKLMPKSSRDHGEYVVRGHIALNDNLSDAQLANTAVHEFSHHLHHAHTPGSGFDLEQHAPLKQLMGVLTRTASFKELQIAARANTGSQTKMAKWLRYAVDPKELLARSIERATAKLAGRAQPNYGDANVYTLLTDAEIDAIIPYVRSYFQSLSVGSVLSANRQSEIGGVVGQGRGTTGPDEVSGRSVGTAGIGDSGGIGDEVARSTPAPNETQSRFASPNEAARVINGPRTDAMVADQARRWLDSVDTQTAVEQFVAQAVPLPLDAAEHAAALLISRLTSESTTNGTEVQRLWAHVQSQRMARVWTREFLSADPARALRQRGVVNNTILQPIAPVMAAQGILVDRADAVMDKRFEGGGTGAVEKITRILNDVQGDITERVEAILNAVMGARLKPRVTIREAVAGLVNGKTQRDEMIDDVARALLQKAKSSQVKPEQKTALAALVASLKRTLGAAVRGKPLKPDALSFGELLARTFVDQVAEAPMFEESWKAGREQVRLMLIELGMTESAALKRLNELMPATPTVAYAPGMVKQAVQRGFEAAGYGQTLATGADQSGQRAVDVRAEVLRNPQRAMEAVMRVWDEEAQAGGISPEAWAQGRPLAVRALNETLQQWQQQAAETTAKAAEATKNRLLAKDSPALAKLLKELAAKIAPGMNWAEIFTDMPSTQKARQIEIYRRLMLDERLQGLTQDERLALTNELDKAWQRERRKVFNRELEKAGVLGEKDKTDRVKVQKALPKLLRMINLGMFNSEMWREAVAPEYGLRMLTAADTAQLRTLAEAAWKLPEGVIRNQKLRDLLNAIQKKTGASWIEVLNSYWTAAVLSGLRTQFDTWLAAINGMGTNLMQIGGLMARGQGRAAIDAHAQWWRGLFEGVRESGQILFKGDTSYLKRFGADLKKALEGETSVTPVPLGENLWKNGNTFQKYGLAPVMMFTGRLMAAADHINNTATTQGAIAVARALHPELYQGRVGFTASERADARTQALREVTGGAEPKTSQERATVSARTREILNGTVKPADYAAASEIGDMAAYQNDPTGVFGIIYSAMKQGLGSIQRGLGDYAQDVTANRFYRVISGVMAGSLHGITGTRFMRFGANFGADLTRYIPGSYVLGKAGFYGRDVSRMQQELLLGKNLVGLMLASTLAAIFLNSDDEDEGWQIEGDWSTLNPQQAKERMAAGYERLTMWKREGGKVRRVSYKQWPTMGLFAVVGGMLDEKRHKPASWAERGTAGHLLRGVATGYTQVKNVSAVRNLVELFGEPSFSSDKVTSTIDQMIKTGTGFAGGFMPTLVKDAEAWTDPRNFKPEGAAELMLRSMPIARKFVNDGRPQLNLLGEEVKLQRTPWSRAYTSVESGEAHRVLGALLARGLSLPMPSDQVTVIQDNVRVPLETLGRDAVWRYEKAVGQGYKDWLSLEGSDLLKLPVQEADARIKARSAAIKARAKASVVK
jgi:hypothetical protein